MSAAQPLSAAQARRIAIAAQGLHHRPRAVRVDRRQLRAVVQRTRALQIDSINVVQRAHYFPAFSRVGAYDIALLDRLAYRDRELFEYWGHEASLLPVELHPLLRWRMQRAADGVGIWRGVAAFARERRDFIEHVYSLVRDNGALTAGEIAQAEQREKLDWGWNWSDEKTALEYLLWSGRVAAADRRNFERRYDVIERVVPAAVLDVPTPTVEDAQRELLLQSARALGVATAADLAWYFRIGVTEARPRLAELVESGALVPARVEGWRQPAYLDPAAATPRRVDGRALLVPFDPLLWERDRVERLFGFRYRVEIYVPAARRVHGYYVLPFLLGDRLVARVDLKSDRPRRALLVQSAYAEATAPAHTAAELATELRRLAGWLDLDDVAVRRRGDLAAPLAAALAAAGPTG